MQQMKRLQPFRENMVIEGRIMNNNKKMNREKIEEDKKTSRREFLVRAYIHVLLQAKILTSFFGDVLFGGIFGEGDHPYVPTPPENQDKKARQKQKGIWCSSQMLGE